MSLLSCCVSVIVIMKTECIYVILHFDLRYFKHLRKGNIEFLHFQFLSLGWSDFAFGAFGGFSRKNAQRTRKIRKEKMR